MLDYDTIETPENVALELRLAGIGSRFVAGVLDHLLLALIYLVLATFLILFFSVSRATFLDALQGTGYYVVALTILIFFLVHSGYFAFFELVMNGQTPGKRVMKLRVVKEGGSSPSVMDIVLRNLLRIVDNLPMGYALGGLSMFLSRKVQRLGDLAAGTVVISEQTVSYGARSDKRVRARWDEETTPEALRASGLTPPDYRALNNYWIRRGQLTLEARKRILPRLLEPILARTRVQLPDNEFETLEAYVEGLMAAGRGATPR